MTRRQEIARKVMLPAWILAALLAAVLVSGGPARSDDASAAPAPDDDSLMIAGFGAQPAANACGAGCTPAGKTCFCEAPDPTQTEPDREPASAPGK